MNTVRLYSWYAYYYVHTYIHTYNHLGGTAATDLFRHIQHWEVCMYTDTKHTYICNWFHGKLSVLSSLYTDTTHAHPLSQHMHRQWRTHNHTYIRITTYLRTYVRMYRCTYVRTYRPVHTMYTYLSCAVMRGRLELMKVSAKISSRKIFLFISSTVTPSLATKFSSSWGGWRKGKTTKWYSYHIAISGSM